MTTLFLEAELGGERFNHAALERAVAGLQTTTATTPHSSTDAAPPVDATEALPTNLL